MKNQGLTCICYFPSVLKREAIECQDGTLWIGKAWMPLTESHCLILDLKKKSSNKKYWINKNLCLPKMTWTNKEEFGTMGVLHLTPVSKRCSVSDGSQTTSSYTTGIVSSILLPNFFPICPLFCKLHTLQWSQWSSVPEESPGPYSNLLHFALSGTFLLANVCFQFINSLSNASIDTVGRLC